MKKAVNRRQFLTTLGVGVVAINYNDHQNNQFGSGLPTGFSTPDTIQGNRGNVPQSAYSLLSTGSVKPRGWIFEQMHIDFRDGLKGHFPMITNNVTQNLFATQQRQAGTMVSGARGRKEKAWWAGEHEGYWMDSITRSAILLDDKEQIAIVGAWIERILVKFEETGYIGIYDANTRFPAKGFDGELWTQSRAFQAMLAWYEYTGDKRVLNAVAATARKTIEHYRQGTYFGRPGSDGGVTHGVGYMDTLEWLCRLTGDRYFADAAVWLYTDYSNNTSGDFDDLVAHKMGDAELPWFDHGAHIGEAVYLPRIAHFFSGNSEFGEAAKNVFPKLKRHTNPSGGMAIGSLEAVAGAQGGGHVLNENCAHIEALMSLNRLFAYQPDTEIGDWREKCIFNVVQGARFHPVDRAVTYLSRDNRRHATDPKAHGGRELFSACHTSAACCALNVPRVMPYYIEGMWYRSNERTGLLVNGYGPSLLTTKIGETELRIEEVTDYPFSDKIEFKVDPAKPLSFEIALRIPPGCGEVKIDAGKDAKIMREQHLIRISKTWQSGDILSVDLCFKVVRKVQHDGKEAYWQWGALVFSLPFEAKEEIRTAINANEGVSSGFFEYLVSPIESEGWNYLAGVDSAFKLVRTTGDKVFPWVKPPVSLVGNLYDRKGKQVDVQLVPLGSSALRRTTFPLHESVPANANGINSDKVTEDNDPMRLF